MYFCILRKINHILLCIATLFNQFTFDLCMVCFNLLDSARFDSFLLLVLTVDWVLATQRFPIEQSQNQFGVLPGYLLHQTEEFQALEWFQQALKLPGRDVVWRTGRLGLKLLEFLLLSTNPREQ